MSGDRAGGIRQAGMEDMGQGDRGTGGQGRYGSKSGAGTGCTGRDGGQRWDGRLGGREMGRRTDIL